MNSVLDVRRPEKGSRRGLGRRVNQEGGRLVSVELKEWVGEYISKNRKRAEAREIKEEGKQSEARGEQTAAAGRHRIGDGRARSRRPHSDSQSSMGGVRKRPSRCLLHC
jgi:hypothetical protein